MGGVGNLGGEDMIEESVEKLLEKQREIDWKIQMLLSKNK